MFDARTGRPVSFNREARRIVEGLRMAGRPVEELLEVLTFRRADGREVSLSESPLAELLRTGKAAHAEEVVLSVPDGRSVTVLLNATPIRADDSETVSVVVTMQDLAPLQELERLRAEFLGLVSHELRTPLTSIRGSASTLLEEDAELDPAERREFYRIIHEQAGHMRGLIGDLLDAGRIEAGTLSVAPELSEVAVLVDRARNTFLSGGARHSVLIDLPGDLPPVMADRRRIRRSRGICRAGAPVAAATVMHHAPLSPAAGPVVPRSPFRQPVLRAVLATFRPCGAVDRVGQAWFRPSSCREPSAGEAGAGSPRAARRRSSA